MYLAASSAMADDGSSANAATPSSSSEGQASRQSNLQRIQQRKQQVYNWVHSKKLLKLAIYSACQVNCCEKMIANNMCELFKMCKANEKYVLEV